MAQHFRVKWSNHMNNMLDVIKTFLSTESLVDVTIACDGMSIKAHKLVLSACSPFFQSLLSENPCQHPIIIIPHMKFNELKPLIEFMYEGEISVTRDQLATLAKNAQELKVRGLAEISAEKTFYNETLVPTDHGSMPLTELSSANKYTGGQKTIPTNWQKQSHNDFKCGDDSKDKKVKSVSSVMGELSNSISIDANNHYEAPVRSPSSQSNDSSQICVLPESADIISFNVELSKSSKKIVAPNNFSSARKDETSLQSRTQHKTPEISTDSFLDASPIPMPLKAMGSDDHSENLQDIKSEPIESDQSMSPLPGPSHDTEDSMMMDQSSISSRPEDNEEDNNILEPLDSQPEGNSSVIRTIYFSKNDNEAKSDEEASKTKKKWNYKCYKCNLLVASKGHLNIHMRTHTGERPFSCHVCGKSCIRQHDLQMHMRTHTGIKPYACPICAMKFNNPSNYRRHYKRRHPTAERVVQVCKLCEEQFDSKELLNGHLINRHSIQNSHICVICQKSYKRQYDLKTHLRVHSKEKPYSCKVCFKHFSYKSNQIRHIRQHFKKTKSSSAPKKQQATDPDYIPESDT